MNKPTSSGFGLESEDSRGELWFTRVFEAPRELVFLCLTEPEHLTHFWGPTGVSAPLERIRVDARPGGAFETVMVNDSDGSEYVMRAVYDEVRPPELLSWTDVDTGARVSSELVELAPDRTELRIHQMDVPQPFMAGESQKGFMTSLERFAVHLARLTRTTPDPGASLAEREEG
jgi:uncharacterized protein YndB with AHSA1/START domain